MQDRTSTILLVDDNETLLMTKKLFFQHHGYRVITAVTAFSAIEACKLDSISLVITDYYLPDMTGDELCRKLKRMHEDIPLVITSGTIPDELTDCADYFVVKGGDPRRLLERVSKLLPKAV